MVGLIAILLALAVAQAEMIILLLYRPKVKTGNPEILPKVVVAVVAVVQQPLLQLRVVLAVLVVLTVEVEAVEVSA